MKLQEKIEVFEKLGIFLKQFAFPVHDAKTDLPWLRELNSQFLQPLEAIIQNSNIHNPWFTENNMRFALGHTGRILNAGNLSEWLGHYDENAMDRTPKTIAVVMAGNIPLVGFHDMLCVLISGHNMLAKLSVKDDQLLKLLSEILYSLDDYFLGKIEFAGSRLKDFDAVIATGSNNTSRYFEYYFSKYPSIIRKNRTSVAILDGSESPEELKGLADDVFRYFGLGCRSVSKLYLPAEYDFHKLIEAFNFYSHLADHNHWANNYDYQKAIHLIDMIHHLDTGFLIIRNNASLASPIAVLNYENFSKRESALEQLKRESGSIQCITGNPSLSEGIIPFGKAQEPGLRDYADNIDTMDFLINL
ncbi:MAG: acyl-CoA reductase [Bacteroidales bacterium]